MTDSMKFGPEWLRNLSADNTSLGSGSGINIIASSHLPAGRNMFPEFRYGREEMLSLFDKNCSMPELLPSYKKIFVEKIQYPLALTPSTDEDMTTQTPVAQTQRSSWLQRSPVGFTTSAARSAGRGGSADRGRLRGKPGYHPVHQRPAAMFEEDLRPAVAKSERGWSERNGSGDVLGNSAAGSGGGAGVEWNGTPTSSPRKEFSSRNLENWRRNRHEEGSGDTANTGIVPTDGWRGGVSGHGGFGSTHRWGRSTSWRDEDVTAANTDGNYSGLGSGSSAGTGGGGGNVTMQRSYSNISTGGYVAANSMSKSSQNSNDYEAGNNQSVNRTLNSSNAGSSHASSRGNHQWANTCGGDGEDNLPEWAMENPSDGGGTFDASGAFHGSIDDVTTDDGNPAERQRSAQRKGSTSSNDSSSAISEKNVNTENDKENNKVNKETDGVEKITSKVNIKNVLSEGNQVEAQKANVKETEISLQSVESILVEEIAKPIDVSSCATNSKSPITASSTQFFSAGIQDKITTHSDYSDRMKEVADDMVEKLIMDDDNNDSNFAKQNQAPIATTKAMSSTATTGTGVQNAFVVAPAAVVEKILKQQDVHHHTVASSSPTAETYQKGVGLYGGIVVDPMMQQQHLQQQHHHELQQQQQQQQQNQLAAAAAAAANLPHELNTIPLTDLWFYRDPQSKVQGPFTAIEMTEWYRAGYFNENLFVRRVCDAAFRSLGDLIKLCQGNMPFTHSHLIPLRLDAMQHMPNSAGLTQLRDKPTMNDFSIKQQQQQQHNDLREELKLNVTAAADSLSAAVKNLISTVDMSEILHMHFQMLQDQYIRHQEMVIVAELSKSECFQHLSPNDKDAILRQKVQLITLPDYLTSLDGLSNSLATLNPAAGLQLYDAITACSKKNQMYATGINPSYQQSKPVNAFIDTNEFLLNVQHHHQQQQQQPQPAPPFSTAYSGAGLCQSNESSTSVKSNHQQSANNNDLLGDINLRMFLQGGGNMNTSSQAVMQPKAQDFMRNATEHHPGEFLNEQQIRAATAVSLSPIMQMWMPQMNTAANTSSQHHQQIIRQQMQAQSNQWANGPLVGISSDVMSSAQLGGATGGNVQQQQQQKAAVPASMWDATLTHFEQPQILQSLKQQQQQQLNAANMHDHESQNQLQHLQPKVPPIQLKLPQQQQLEEQLKETQNLKNFAPTHQQQQQQQQLEMLLENMNDYTLVGGGSKQNREDRNEKLQRNANKRSSNNKQPQQQFAVVVNKQQQQPKDEKKIEEERRREAAEEKRRQKEERKRQQIEEDKKRMQQIEEEKRRQLLEEKERQQRIHAQRRKAMLGSDANAAAGGSMINSEGGLKVGNYNKDRLQSSVAPWSTQTTVAATNSGPGLAEIQKAERRERRADQQRQMEVMEKQMRANAAANAEANDAMLKWNASTVPLVKSFAEIQAEEAKRLASEQLEMQRRREQEQQQQQHQQQQAMTVAANMSNIGGGVIASTAGSGVSAANNISAIWGGTKVWGSTSGTAGFWEEPVKFSAAANSNTPALTAAAAAAAALPKAAAPTTSSALGFPKQEANAARATNLRKSQTVSIMQSNSSTQPVTKSLNKTSLKNEADKKVNTKNQNVGAVGGGYNTNKKDNLENEFNGWCIKSLTQMNTKVDVPTFVTFLQDLESPYEVKDYIRMYLGESREYTEFGKQFLERRSKYKNMQRAQNAHNDDMCKPAPAITPSGNDNTDCKGKQKKVKKGKMTKLDARILGFSVTAAEGRINVGDRDYVDAQ